jgi:hypothetical protein
VRTDRGVDRAGIGAGVAERGRAAVAYPGASLVA